jgi:hypothetical protein
MQAGLGSFYSWSVFREPLSSLYGANITEVNVAFFLASFVRSRAPGRSLRRGRESAGRDPTAKRALDEGRGLLQPAGAGEPRRLGHPLLQSRAARLCSPRRVRHAKPPLLRGWIVDL